MHILTTDVLTCPRCGPQFGLIVLADRMEDRYVLEGRLGCANCREAYAVRAGVADLRFPPGASATGPAPRAGDEEAAVRLAALLGVGSRPGTVLLLGAPGPTADEVARLLPAVQVVAASAEDAPAPPGEGRASRLRVGEVLPFRDRSLQGVAMSSGFAPELLGEALRVLAPAGHLVLDPAPPGALGALAEAGFRVLLEQDEVVVASLSPAR